MPDVKKRGDTDERAGCRGGRNMKREGGKKERERQGQKKEGGRESEKSKEREREK